MESRDAVTAMAKLLAEPALLDLYERKREAAAELLRIDDKFRAAFLTWDVAKLRRQARGLVDKRRYEVSRFLPRTFERLGLRGERIFAEFASARWPAGHRRHAADALAFARWLRDRREPAWCAEEQARLEILLGKFAFGVRLIANFASRRGPRRALVFLLRRKGRIRTFAVFLA